MKYKILNENYQFSLIERLLQNRGITHPDSFFHPSFAQLWNDPFLLNDMEKATHRIIQWIKKNERIFVFWDYDVDGITASFCLFKFMTKFLNYQNISILYPDRCKDGYGMKNHHLDLMKEKWATLIITVDNGITSVEEAEYAKQLGLELIITDHHQILDKIPQAYAVVNQNCSKDYPFKDLAWVWIAFKLICAMLQKSTFSTEKKNQIFNYFLPLVTIGSIADVVPLLDENRLLVKKGLELINKWDIPNFLQGFLDYLQLKWSINSTKIAFNLAPRINAWGRIASPYDSLALFLHEWNEQIPYLDHLEKINTQRKKIQDEWINFAEETLDFSKKILIVAKEDFHEGVIGIIAGKLTEKYNKPSIVFKIDRERNLATASLRWPDYFSIIDMLSAHQTLLERCWWHKWAWWLTVSLDHFDELCEKLEQYCNEYINDEDLEKEILIDTKIQASDWNAENLDFLSHFEPFGEWNSEPTFLFENIEVNHVETFGKSWAGNLKIFWTWEWHVLQFIFRWKGNQTDLIPNTLSLIGKIENDTFNGWYLVIWEEIIENSSL